MGNHKGTRYKSIWDEVEETIKIMCKYTSLTNVYNHITENYKYIGTYSSFWCYCKKMGYHDAVKQSEVRKKCAFPDCFKCPFDDCKVNDDRFGTGRVNSELLYSLSHKGGG